MPLDPPTRRTVLKAGAWTAPAIVVMTAVPAYAASGEQPLSMIDLGTAFSDARVDIWLRVTNGSAVTTIPVDGLRVTNTTGSSWQTASGPAGWNFVGTTDISFTWSNAVSLAPGATIDLRGFMATDNDPRPFSSLASATGFTSAGLSFPASGRASSPRDGVSVAPEGVRLYYNKS